MEEIELGDRVEDRITKMKGIVVATTKWLYGCDRVSIQPEKSKDGKPAETFGVDRLQCCLIKKHAVANAVEEQKPEKKKSSGGPKPDVSRGRDVTR